MSDKTSRAFQRFQIELFLYLQVLDIMTTLAGFSLGNGEASPFIKLMIRWGPVNGLIVSKIVAVGMAAVCLRSRKPHLIRAINYWYGALALWNLYTIIKVLNS